MSEEMRAKKLAEEQAVKEEEKQLEHDLKDMEKDICPHCLQPVSSFPYLTAHPNFAWIECAACGIVFCPQSIRNVKIRKSKTITAPRKRLFIPK